MDNRFVKIGIAMFLLLIGVAGWWFFYYTKTPTYSLGIIKKSIEQHDSKTFQKHVNIDSIINNAIDEKIESSKGTNNNSPFINGLINIVKSNLIEKEKKEIFKYIETGKDSNKDNGSLMSFVSTKEFVDIGEIHKEGKHASVEIIANDQYLGGVEFTFIIDMRELEDGTWEVTKFSNFDEYKNTVEKIQKQQLKDYIDAIDSKSEEMEYEKEICLVFKDMNDSSDEGMVEKLKKVIKIQSKFNDAVSDIYVPVGAKEYASLRQIREKYKYDTTILGIKLKTEGALSKNEMKQYNEVYNKAKEAGNQLDNIRKQAGLPYNDSTPSYEKKCAKYE